MENKNLEKDKVENQDLIMIRWEAPEFEEYEKGPKWFILVGILALTIFTISLLMKNFIFSAMIIIAVFTIFIYALKKPRVIKFIISGDGLKIGEKLYSYPDLESFWIFYRPGEIKELSVKSKRWLMPLIKIPIAEQDPVEIRQTLIKFIPEKRQEESLIDILARKIGF